MIFIAPRSIDDTQIAVTGTATLLYELMGTAGSANPSTIQSYYSADGNAVWLYCATNSFRFAFGTPTAGKGALVQTGERRLVMGDLSTLKLIRTGGSNATVDVEVGRASEFESVFGMANTASVTVTADTEFAAAAALNGTWAKTTVSTISGAAVMANDGTNLVLVSGDTTNGLDVDVTRINGVAPTFANVTPTATLTGYQNILAGAVYNASPTARTEGQWGPLQAFTDGSLQISGNIASGATDSGNPIKLGARYNTTKPTFTNGQRGDLQIGTRGSLGVTLFGEDNVTSVSVITTQDGATTGNYLKSFATIGTFNGTNWDQGRSVVNATNSTGTGIQAVGLVGQLNETSPQVVTENQFGNVRINPVGILLTEHSYTYGRATADTQIASASAFIHTVSISATTATPVAGLLTIYDNTAESGTVVYSEWITTSVAGHTVILDVKCGTGIYVSFDASLANVQATVAYRLNT